MPWTRAALRYSGELAMSSVPSKVKTTESRTRSVAGARRKMARAVSLRHLYLESLEERALLATIPAATVSNQIDASVNGPGGNMSAPAIAVNPLNPQQLAAFWTRLDPGNLGGGGTTQSVLEGAYSNNGGTSWVAFPTSGGGFGGSFFTSYSDPTTSNPVIPFVEATDANVSFDRSGNVYAMASEHNANSAAGALVLYKFDFNSLTNSFTSDPNVFHKVLYSWTQNAALKPTLAVDNNVASFTDPTTGQTQIDASAGNVYVAWATNDPPPSGATNWNTSTLKIIASSDGGQTFSGATTLNDNGNAGTNADHVTSPKIVISQGNVSGTVKGGQVTVVWDDYVSGGTANPPVDFIVQDVLQGVQQQSAVAATPVVIQDAGPNNAPTVTTVPFLVQANANLTVDNIAVSLNVNHNNLNELGVVLVAPDGVSTLTLFPAGTGGASGTNLGLANTQFNTTFTDSGVTTINNGAAPFLGTFRASGGQFRTAFASYYNQPLAAGVWTLRITDSTTTTNPPLNTVNYAELKFAGGLVSGPDKIVASTTVRGAQGTSYGTGSAGAPAGIGPGIQITSDNTLGSFSPFEGRLYLTYVNRSTATGNPTDNTDIYLLVSDDGGTTWRHPTANGTGTVGVPSVVNNDFAVVDGFSEGTPGLGSNSGRAQWMPEIAVDQTTGTLVVTYFDGRFDASRQRVARMIAASIDGGTSFGTQTWANASQLVYDQATNTTKNLGPVMDNLSSTNNSQGIDRTTYGFGDDQGLAVLGGHVYPAWTSNVNIISTSNANTPKVALAGGVDNKYLNHIRVAQATIATGPRIISGTQGPVGLAGDAVNTLPTAADGTPTVNAFVVTFDRPIDPNSFTINDVTVYFHDTVNGSAPVAITPVSVTPLNTGAFGPNNIIGATSFKVTFTPDNRVGTYSYAVGPAASGTNIQDRIRSTTTQLIPIGSRSTVSSGTINTPLPDLQTTQSPLFVAGFPAADVVYDVKVNVSISHPQDSDLVLTLIAPDGTRILLSNHRGGFFGANYTNTTFDDSAVTPISAGFAPFTGSFRPDSLLSQAQGIQINGLWRLEVADTVNLNSGTLLNWSLDFQPATASQTTLTGNKQDQNANAIAGQTSNGADAFAVPTPKSGIPFSGPYTTDTLPLVVTGPHVISTSIPFTSTGGTVAGTSDNLVTDGTVSAIDVTFDRNMNPNTFTPSQVLRIQGPAGLISGPFTITPNPNGTDPNASFPRTYRINFPTQQLSGTYTIELGSSITSQTGYQMDANLNAGVDVLRGTPSGGQVSLTQSSTLPVVIAPQSTVTSTITLNQDFPISSLTLQLSIAYPNDPDLTAFLVAPDGTRIKLFSGVGGATPPNYANFTNTVFDDTSATPIGNGAPPFTGRFQPVQPLSALNGSSSVKGPGGTGAGVYTLEITNSSATQAGTLSNWALTFQKPTPSSGLGEPVADRTPLSFRIFTMDPTNPLSSSTWTSVGPASIGGSRSGRIGGLAVDPSDPTGNTVYVAGASGGVWKTNNFLTTSPLGPTYIPLTDFGPTFGINIGGLAVFGRNNDPNQSIIFASTGEGDTGSRGVGVLRSTDGGATWTLLDSTDNTKPLALRDHAFVGSTSFKIIVDPHASASGNVIVYMALSGNNGGIWRSLDSGATWGLVDPNSGARVPNLAGQATDVVLDPTSGTVSVNNPTGNDQVVYGAIRGSGVYISPNQGNSWSIMGGGAGDPTFLDTSLNPVKPVPVNNLGVNPNGAFGRIVLAKPDLVPSTDPNSVQKNLIYAGWLYAVVVTPDNHLQGLYVTKDQGLNWTKISMPTLPANNGVPSGIPSNDQTRPQYDVLGNSTFAQGNYDVSLVVDPTNPAIVYLGGTADGNPWGLQRIDCTGLVDPHAFFLSSSGNDGQLSVNTSESVTLKQNPLPGASGNDPRLTPTINLTRNPAGILSGNSQVVITTVASFANSGSGATWTGFDQALAGSTDQHRVVAIRDPLTGHARLIFGDDQGVFSAVDDGTGQLVTGVGSLAEPSTSRNGNLQITQFYYGASQPSSAAAQIAGALLYGSAQDDGSPVSNPNILNKSAGAAGGYGNLIWNGPGGDASGVATDQTGTGTFYQYRWPCCGGNFTDFFLVNNVGKTQGLLQVNTGGNSPDPQWPFVGGFNFAVNPIDGSQIVISSGAGRVFRTENTGNFWLVIGDPAQLDGTNAQALAFGAPDPATSNGSLDNFIYAGTAGGHIYVTFTGGGTGANSWININNGALALSTAPVMKIVTNPTRGSHAAYAVTTNGVYYISDSNPASGQVWQDITGNLFQITHNSFGNPALNENQLSSLSSIQADWRYLIPDDFANPNGPNHPMLYVGGNGGIYRSFDNGSTWLPFPSAEPGSINTTPTPPGAGGGFPNAEVSDLNLALGNVDPTTGRPIAVAGDPGILLATTYGRGMFAIRIAPVVLASSLALDTTLPSPGGSVGGIDTNTGLPLVKISQPYIDGFSEQTASGNRVRITLWDYTDPANPKLIGGYDPSNPATDTAANWTDNFGHFAVQVNASALTSNGIKTIGVQATDLSGIQGNIATFQFVLNATTTNPNQPPATPSIAMLPADDSSGQGGIPNTTTNIISPHIIGVTDPSVQVQLFMSDGTNTIGAALATGTTDNFGNYSLQFPNPNPSSPDGTYTIMVVATNANGSSKSVAYTFTVKSTAPAVAPTLALRPSDDTGPLDGITANRRPHFDGVAEPGAKITLYQVLSGGQLLALTTPVLADPTTGAFTIQLPSNLSTGSVVLKVGETDIAGNPAPPLPPILSNPVTVTIVSVLSDYTASYQTTPAIFRRSSNGSGLWFIKGNDPTTGLPYPAGIPFGSAATSVPFTGDFDGDGTADLAVYVPSIATWFIHRSSLGDINYPLGNVGDVPVVGNFDGSGVTQTGAYNAKTGTWTLATNTSGTQVVTFPSQTVGGTAFTPASGDIPVPGDYEGIGKDQLAIYRPSTGAFYILGSNGQLSNAMPLSTGTPGDIPVPGNYDNSVSYHKTELAVFNPTTGVYLIAGPGGNQTIQFQPGDIPAPGDYAGTGSLQPVVYRPAAPGVSGRYIGAGNTLIATYGGPGDIPLTSPLVYRDVVGTTPTLALDPASDTGFAGDNVTSIRLPSFLGKTDPNTLVDLVDANGKIIAPTVTSDASGNFRFNNVSLSPTNHNGTYTVAARAHGPVSNIGLTSTPVTVRLITVTGDFTGTGKTTQTVYRRVNSSLITWLAPGYAPLAGFNFGAGALDVPVGGDFNGDGKFDLAVYRPSTTQWYVRMSTPTGYTSSVLQVTSFAGQVGDIPIPGVFTNSGSTSIAVYRPTTGQWFVNGVPGFGYLNVPPKAGDVPVPSNYDNTGKDEFAIYRPAGPGVSGQWIISSPGGVHSVFYGGPGDVPVPGAYDATTSSQASELSVFRPSTGQWFIKGHATPLQFKAGDIPVPGDYDGVGYTEPAVYRPSTGQWFVWSRTDTAPRALNPANFGVPSVDYPVNSPYIYRALKSGGGVVSAFGTPSGTLNLGSTAASLSAASSVATAAPVATPTTTPPVATTRLRPAQSARLAHRFSANAVHHLITQAILSTKKKPTSHG